METSGLRPNQVAQIRGYADQDLRNKDAPEDPSNRRVSLIVRYLDPAKPLSLGVVGGKVKQTEQHPAVNPAVMPLAIDEAAKEEAAKKR
jgi:chemotaxis protein MotB